MPSFTVLFVDLDKLAADRKLGSVLVRMMMALNDIALANDGMGRWMREDAFNLQERKLGASRYFLRLLMAHVFEALEIIKEIRRDAALMRSVERCDSKTQESFSKLLELLDGDDYELFARIRNNLTFHYGETVVRDGLQRLANQLKKKKVAYTIGEELIRWHFPPAEMVESDIVVRAIFKVPDGDPTDLQKDTDQILVRLQTHAIAFGDFAAYFIKTHAKAW